MEKYTKRQLLFLVTIALADFGTSLCFSLQAPFYPAEAERKGASATQYGTVFGVFELTVFLVSMVYGRFMKEIGPSFLLTAGLFLTGSSCILFGLLDKVNNLKSFLCLSYAIRITEGLGTGAFLTTSFSLIAVEFPNSVGGTFATLDIFYGAGLSFGPSIGGALYEAGGFSLPFLMLGIFLLIIVLIIKVILPPEHYNSHSSNNTSSHIFKILSLPIVLILIYANIVSAVGFGFLQATLEPHLRPLGLGPFKVGLMFIINGGTYIMFVPMWGILCDRCIKPRNVVATGTFITMMAFTFIGPVSFIPLKTTLATCIMSLLMNGVGLSAMIVGTFSGTQKELLNEGFSDDLETYSLVSGIWTSSFSLGTFLGPSIGGYLCDKMGFRSATILLVVLYLVALLWFALHYLMERHRNARHSSGLHIGTDEERRLLGGHERIYATCDYFYDEDYNSSSLITLENSITQTVF